MTSVFNFTAIDSRIADEMLNWKEAVVTKCILDFAVQIIG
jgi:hypothetical protein